MNLSELKKEADNSLQGSIETFENGGEQSVARASLWALQSIAASNLVIIQLLESVITLKEERGPYAIRTNEHR